MIKFVNLPHHQEIIRLFVDSLATFDSINFSFPDLEFQIETRVDFENLLLSRAKYAASQLKGKCIIEERCLILENKFIYLTPEKESVVSSCLGLE